MLVLDPIVVAAKTLPPWAVTLGSIAIATALLAQYTRSFKGKSTVKPRKIHSLGMEIPIVGDMLETLKHEARHDWILATCLQFQHEPWQINVPGKPTTIVLSDPASAEAVLVAQPDIFITRNVEQVYDHLDAHCGTGRLASLDDLFQQFTLQTFLEVGVGIDAPIIGKSEPEAFKALDEAAILINRRQLLPAFINDNADGDERVKVRTAVELFVEHSGDDKAGLRPRDLVDFVLGFLFASRDTSAVSTMWFFYEPGQHPEIETKIRAELAVKLPQLGVGRDGYITADHVKELVYLDAVIKETLRFRPAGPLMSRMANQDTVINGDIFIQKGQIVNLSMYAMARNPRVWGPDAAEFKPERWIDAKAGELRSFPATEFLTFGAGPHSCLGMKLAMLNLRVLTANLLHRYKFEIDPACDGSHINAMMLAMKHNLVAKVERV